MGTKDSSFLSSSTEREGREREGGRQGRMEGLREGEERDAGGRSRE